MMRTQLPAGPALTPYWVMAVMMSLLAVPVTIQFVAVRVVIYYLVEPAMMSSLSPKMRW